MSISLAITENRDNEFDDEFRGGGPGGISGGVG